MSSCVAKSHSICQSWECRIIKNCQFCWERRRHVRSWFLLQRQIIITKLFLRNFAIKKLTRLRILNLQSHSLHLISCKEDQHTTKNKFYHILRGSLIITCLLLVILQVDRGTYLTKSAKSWRSYIKTYKLNPITPVSISKLCQKNILNYIKRNTI